MLIANISFRAIDALAKWISPILQGAYARTGFHFSLLGGGPLPKKNGAISVMCISAGRNRQVAAKPYSEWPGFRQHGSGHYRAYLESAFSTSSPS